MPLGFTARRLICILMIVKHVLVRVNPETKAMISRQCACFLSCLAQSPAWIMALCVFRVLPALLYGETIGFQSIGFHVNNRLPHGFSFVMILVSKATVFKSLSAIFRLHLKEF